MDGGYPPPIWIDQRGVVFAALAADETPDSPMLYGQQLLDAIRLIVRSEVERALRPTAVPTEGV